MKKEVLLRKKVDKLNYNVIITRSDEKENLPFAVEREYTEKSTAKKFTEAINYYGTIKECFLPFEEITKQCLSKAFKAMMNKTYGK